MKSVEPSGNSKLIILMLIFIFIEIQTKHHMTTKDQENILYLRDQGNSYRQIAKATNMSLTQVAKFLQKKTFRNVKEARGRKSILTRREKCLIKRLAKHKLMNSTEIKETIGTSASARTIRRCLKKDHGLVYSKHASKPVLTKSHKETRVLWATKYIDLSSKWNDVIFSDEKKFNLDGPDGVRKFWCDRSIDKKTFSKRQNGGGAVMVWAAFSASGKTSLAILNGRQTAASYISTLQANLLPFIELQFGESAIFQQDNCPIHTATSTKSWLQAQGINLMDWPSNSPDLNPMENLWGLLVQSVYKNGRQFESRDSLIKCITKCWNDISENVLQSLVSSMKMRCVKIVANKGAFLKY